MEKIKEKIKEIISKILNKPLYAAITGLVIGLIIGLPILGWGLFPVKWKDADPSYLREDLKKQYTCMLVDSYALNRDVNLAATRLKALGVEDLAKPQGAFKNLQLGGCSYASSDPVILELKTALLVVEPGKADVVSTEKPVKATEESQPQAPVEKENKGRGTLLLVVLVWLFLLIAGALLYIFFLRNRRSINGPSLPQDDEESYLEDDIDQDMYAPEELDNYRQEEVNPEIEEPIVEESVIENTDVAEVEIQPTVMETKIAAPIMPPTMLAGEPVAHFMTSYLIGDDLYDDSFSIDAPNGAFLGECGVGISDTIGVGDPKKVTAFEVWLFDKNDIQTVTKVLMSSHALNDSGIKQRLASKGEPVLMEPGQAIVLETATLQLEAKVIEMVYGQGALPTGSFVERLTLELSVWPK